MPDGNVTVIPAMPRRRCELCAASARPEEMKNGRCWRCSEMVEVPGGPWTLKALEERFPHIDWREPVTMALIDKADEKHYACRVCIANGGIKGEAIPQLPSDPEIVREHIVREHA